MTGQSHINNIRIEANFEEWLRSGAIFGADIGRVLIGWGEKKRGKQPFEGLAPSFYFPDYFLKDLTPWLQYEHHQEINIKSLLSLLASVACSASMHLDWEPSQKAAFDTTFNELQNEMKEGYLAKAVPFAMETTSVSMQRSQLIQSLQKALCYAETHPVYLYGFWDQMEGMLGVSPEILFEGDGWSLLKTMACAGTRPIEEEESGLLSDSKEQHEHELVVNGIVSSLTPYGKVSVGNRHLLKLSQVMHLVTPIQARLNRPLQFEEMVQALHPTPAVGAFPKKEGTIWLEKYQQKIHRGRFGAPAGYYIAGGKKVHCCVAIRNVQWTNREMRIAAGCGVVTESQCDREWEEIQLKLKMIKEMLAL